MNASSYLVNLLSFDYYISSTLNLPYSLSISSTIFTQLHHRLYSVRMQYFHLQALAQKAHIDHEPPARIEGVDFVPARQKEWTDQDDNTMVDAVWPRSEEDHVGEEGLMVQLLEGSSKMSLDFGADDVEAEADTEEDANVDADEEMDDDDDVDELDGELDLDAHVSREIEIPNEAVAVNQDDANVSNTRAEVDREQGGTVNATSGARDLPERKQRRLSLYKNFGSGEAERGKGRQGRRSQRRSIKMDNQREGRSGSGQGILRFLFPGLVALSMNSDYVAISDEATSGSYTLSTSGSPALSTASLSTVTMTGSSIHDTAPAPVDKDDDLPLRVLSKTPFYPTPSVALLTQPAPSPMASASGEYSAYTQIYPPTKHAYAARALVELESVAHEQAAWEFDMKEWERRARGETEGRGGHMPQVPGLFVEWPKYWNWEKPII